MLFLKEIIYILSLFVAFYFIYKMILNRINNILVKKYHLHVILMSISIIAISHTVDEFLFYYLEVRVDFLISSHLPLIIINNTLLIIYSARLVVLLIIDVTKRWG